MPHWDFKCVKCGVVADLSFLTYEASTEPITHTGCGGTIERVASSASFKVAATVETKTEMIGGLKVTTTIRGNETIDDYV